MKTITIDKEITDIIPEFNIQAFKFSMDVKPSSNLILKKMDEYSLKYASISLEEVINLPRIKEGRDAYKKFKKDPSRYRLACESLLRRLSKNMGLYKINNAVDIGNLLSIELNRSTAVLDYDKIINDINVRLGKIDDEYYGIGRGKINIENIPVYVDDIGPFGSVTSDTMRTSITDETKNILLLIICFSNEEVEKAIDKAVEFYRDLGEVTNFERINVQYK